MSARLPHVVSLTTAKTLKNRHERESWRQIAVALGYPKSYGSALLRIANGEPGVITREGEKELRRRLGLSVPRRNVKPALRLSPDLLADIDADRGPGESREDVLRYWQSCARKHPVKRR